METVRMFLANKLKIKTFSAFLFPLQLFLLCCLYTLSGIFGLRVDAVSGFASFIWIPSGLALAALLLYGSRLWPAVTLAALIVNLITGASLPVAIGIAIGNTLEILTATYILQTAQIQFSLQRLRDVVILLLFASPLSSTIAATIGSMSLLFGKTITPAHFFITWQAWFVGDMMSMILLTPFLLTWSSKNFSHTPTIRNSIEMILFFFVTIAICLFIFTGRGSRFLEIYLVFPLIIFAALRFSQRTTITTIFLVTVFSLSSIVYHTGQFVTDQTTNNLLSLQVFLEVVALTGMSLAAVNTERKKFEERKDEFISLASHELKTPLTSLKILTHLTQRSLDQTTKLPQYLQKMDREIDRITSLTSSLLDISRIQAGTLMLEKEIFSCVPFIVDIVDTMQATTRHPIVFHYTKRDKNVQVFADKARFSQVLINFLTNAMKYSSVKKRITVAVINQKHHVVISVKDSGIGIAPEDQSRIFQRYFRANEDNGTTYPGLGLGLYIAQQIVRQHNGKMWVRSAKGKGSTFFVSLPHVIQPKRLNFFSKKDASG